MAETLGLEVDGADAINIPGFALPSSGSAVKRYALVTRHSGSRVKAKFDDSGTDDYGIRMIGVFGQISEERATP